MESFLIQLLTAACFSIATTESTVVLYPPRSLVFAGIDEISVDVYKGVEHSDSEDSEKSESSDSEYGSDDEQKTKDSQDAVNKDEAQKEPTKNKVKDQTSPSQDKEGKAERPGASESAAGDATTAASEASTKEIKSKDSEKGCSEKTKASPSSPGPREKSQVKEEKKPCLPVDDSDSERELVIDLGEDQGGRDKKRSRKDNTTVKESSAGKPEGESCVFFSADPSTYSKMISSPMPNRPLVKP